MGRALILVVVVALLALWITSIAHNQPAVGPDERTLRSQLTVVMGPPFSVTPTTTPQPTATREAG